MTTSTDDLAALSKRFLGVYTATLADVLDELGYRNQALPSEIIALQPGMRLAGPAYPCEGSPGTTLSFDEGMRRMLEWLGAVPAHHVAIYKTNGDTTGHFGDISSASLLARGCTGVVIDGGCRDVAQVLDTGMPVFCRYRNPRDCVSRWELEQWGIEVEIGGVTVRPGDFVLGDADGVMVVPHEVRDEALVKSEEVVASEKDIRIAVDSGLTPLEVYDRFGAF